MEKTQKGRTMKKYSIRYTGRVFKPFERLDDSDFIHTFQEYSCYSAARKEMERLSRDKALGQSAIFALEDIPMQFRCSRCGNIIHYTWFQNTRAPRTDCNQCEERSYKNETFYY